MLRLDADATAAVAAHQAKTGLLFGEAALGLGLVTPDQIQRAIEQQQGFSVLERNDRRLSPLVVSAFDPSDPLALTVRSLRALVTSAKRVQGDTVRTVAVIGLDTGAETPIIAANLAVASAQANYATLLIDADLAAPQQHALFQLSNRQGLTTLLAGATRWQEAIQSTAIRGLGVISGGPAVPNASELLDRRRLADAIEPLSDDKDLIFVDAGNAATTGMIAALGLDATIIVIRRDITETRLLSRVTHQLQESGMLVLGTVLVD